MASIAANQAASGINCSGDVKQERTAAEEVPAGPRVPVEPLKIMSGVV